MVNRPQKKNVSMQQVLTALLDEHNYFPAPYLHHFSDLEGHELEALRSVWLQLSPSRRFSLLEDLEDLAEADTLVSFDNVARLALTDPDPRVRIVGIRLLWETYDVRLANTFMEMLQEDPAPDVRAAAAWALGIYVYKGELEEIPEDLLHRIENLLLKVINGQDEAPVRRRALESMGFSSRPEVPPLIRDAYNSNDQDWLSSALFAMGRSVDPVWEPDVKRMLLSAIANVQLEAVRAAGNLELSSTRRILLDLLEEEAQDSEIRFAVLWSLSQIGGEEVRETLEGILEETEDEEEVDFIENALDNLSFTEDVDLYGLFNFDPSTALTPEDDSYESDIENFNRRRGRRFAGYKSRECRKTAPP